MKIIYISILALVITSCKMAKEEIELTLINNEITCVDNANPKTNEEIHHLMSDSTYNNISKNILSYKLTNNSDEKYFIVLNDNNLTTLENDNSMKITTKDKIKFYNQIAFNLYNDSTILNGESNLFVGSSDGNFQRRFDDDIEFVKDDKNLYNKKITIFYREVLENSFVLHPHETKYFTSVVNLPFRLNGDNWHSIINNKTNYASLTLVNHGKKTESMLSENQKKEIEENGYTVFDGVIQSNKIPVKMVSLPSK